MKADSNYDITWGNDSNRLLLHHEESPESVAERVKTLLDEIEREVPQPSMVVLVAHGDTLQMTQSVFAGSSPWDHRRLSHLETAEIRAAAT